MGEKWGGGGDELVPYTAGLLHLGAHYGEDDTKVFDSGAAFWGLRIRPRIKRGRCSDGGRTITI